MPKAATTSAFYFQTRSPLDHRLIFQTELCMCNIFCTCFSPFVTTAAECLPQKKSHILKEKSVKDMHYVLFVKETNS